MAKREDTEVQDVNRVVLCPDGVYRWIYELNMYRNPVILYTVLKIFGICVGIVVLFVNLLFLLDSNVSFGDVLFQSETKYAAIAFLIFFAVVIVSYYIVAKMHGGKYIVLFEMDDKEIVHQQMDSQFQKMQAINWLTFMAGAVSGNYSMMGLSINNSVRSSMTSEYVNVRKVIPKKRLNTIKVNELLEHNQIYVCDEDFDFVLDYLKSHCKV